MPNVLAALLLLGFLAFVIVILAVFFEAGEAEHRATQFFTARMEELKRRLREQRWGR